MVDLRAEASSMISRALSGSCLLRMYLLLRWIAASIAPSESAIP